MSKAKKLFVKTYGCQMNVYDSERMVETMSEQGYEATDTADNADMIFKYLSYSRKAVRFILNLGGSSS